MNNYLVNITFNGYNYSGTQKNPNKMTIQGIFEDLLTRFFDEKITIKLCSRLDKQVHANSFYFNFKTNKIFNLKKLEHFLNNFTNSDIRINYIKNVSEDFNSRYHAIKKRYVYKIKFGEKSPFDYQTTFISHYKLLNSSKLPLNKFVGTHYFYNFCSSDEKDETFVNTIDLFSVNYDSKKQLFTFTIEARNFFRYQIRYIIGAIYQIMIGKKTEKDIDEMFEKVKYTKPRLLLPGYGLTLDEVFFEEVSDA